MKIPPRNMLIYVLIW